MTTHTRKQIRDAVASAVMGLPDTLNHVYISRVRPVGDANLPCILVYTKSETSKPISMGGSGRTIERLLDVVLEVVIKMNDTFDDKADEVALNIEKAISDSTAIANIVKDIFLKSTELSLMERGEKPVACMSMTFQAKYHTEENIPETSI